MYSFARQDKSVTNREPLLIDWHSSCLDDIGGAADLALNQLACPARRLDRPLRVVAIGARLFDKTKHPLLSQSLGELAVGESLGEITGMY